MSDLKLVYSGGPQECPLSWHSGQNMKLPPNPKATPRLRMENILPIFNLNLLTVFVYTESLFTAFIAAESTF